MQDDTIIAPITGTGQAVALIRLSGPESVAVVDDLFDGDISGAPSHSILFGIIKDGEALLDEVLVYIFKGPNSYTGEDVVEISCHGSSFIQQRILELCTEKGVRMAEPGEFTKRAFLNRKMDLSQAEAVADIIAAESAAAHTVAMHQLRGGFAREIADLREKLIHFASLIELELDFSEEDVEFADRTKLQELLTEIKAYVSRLIDSFAKGNAMKEGVPVVIAGKPNVGKSTLLNSLLNEDKAIVSEVAGTTRDLIEDRVNINGVSFRFIDTAGLRETDDEVEAIGVERALDQIGKSAITLYVYDASDPSTADASDQIEGEVILVANKIDLNGETKLIDGAVGISAKDGTGMEDLTTTLSNYADKLSLTGSESIVTNVRHVDALRRAKASVEGVTEGMANNVSGDLLATDIRQALHYLGEITGEVTVDDLLGNIFSKFCIGK